MVTFTYTSDGVIIRATSSSEIVTEYVKQAENGKMFLKDSYRFDRFSNQHSITVIPTDIAVISSTEIFSEKFDIGNRLIKLLSRDSTSFFFSISEMIRKGNTILGETGFLSTGNYSVHVKIAESEIPYVDPYQNSSPIVDEMPPETIPDHVTEDSIEDSMQVEEEVPERSEQFEISVAQSLQDKDELYDYCKQFGIKLDKRKSLEGMKNSLVTKIQ